MNLIPGKKMLSVLAGQTAAVPPVWLMRQAGRYLPEYREIRAQAGSFLGLAFNPELASEVTLQPIRRFGFDAAILFSDILVVPHALGHSVHFEEGEGPRFVPLEKEKIDKLRCGKDFYDVIEPVNQTISLIREKLSEENFSQTALIGFAGAPWTVACYMIEGQGGNGFPRAQQWREDKEAMDNLLSRLAEATIVYLERQIRAGAEIIQIFESWAGLASPAYFDSLVIKPTKKIVAALKEKFPHVPIIGFPRGAGALYGAYALKTGVTALGLDHDVSLGQARDLQKILPVQGNLDPDLLRLGGGAMEIAISRSLDVLGKGPYIFNLGHGIVKETPPENVQRLMNLIRARQ